MTEKENKLILYKDEEGRVSVNVRFADEDVWLTREHLAQIYATTPQNISLHIGNIYHDKELGDEATRKKFFLVRQEGKRQVQREIDHLYSARWLEHQRIKRCVADKKAPTEAGA